MIAHRYLRGRVDGYLSAMEQAAARLARAVAPGHAHPPGRHEASVISAVPAASAMSWTST